MDPKKEAAAAEIEIAGSRIEALKRAIKLSPPGFNTPEYTSILKEMQDLTAHKARLMRKIAGQMTKQDIAAEQQS